MVSEDALISRILSASIWSPVPLLGRAHPSHYFVWLPANTDLFPLVFPLLRVCAVQKNLASPSDLSPKLSKCIEMTLVPTKLVFPANTGKQDLLLATNEHIAALGFMPMHHDDAGASNICSALLISYASVAFQSSIRQAEQYACSLHKACS
jgi:hypothetical protein